MEQSDIAEQTMVIFAIGRQEYAVPIGVVKEVQSWSRPTPVPEAPPMVEGVIDLRGEIIPVVDLARRFRTTREKQDADARIMVMELDGRHAGWIVDQVVEVHTAAAGTVFPPSAMLASMAGAAGDPVVSAILRINQDRLVVVIDASRVLADALR